MPLSILKRASSARRFGIRAAAWATSLPVPALVLRFTKTSEGGSR